MSPTTKTSGRRLRFGGLALPAAAGGLYVRALERAVGIARGRDRSPT